MKHRILVVQERASFAIALSQKLASVGFDVAFAADGFQALAEQAAFDPDLVLLDLTLHKSRWARSVQESQCASAAFGHHRACR
jgi:DNA-binding response OmpR family regulator